MGQCRGRVWLTVLELVGGLALFEGVQAEVARPSAHSSVCSARTAPTRRMMVSLLGKMPTESVRRRISLLRRSWGLLDQICFHTSTGKVAVGQQVGSRGVEVVSGLGQRVTGVVQVAVELGLDGCCVGLVVNPSGAWS